MKKPIKSNDPRKPAIVSALKRKSGGTKVTNVREIGPNMFSGDCLKRPQGGNPAAYHPADRAWLNLGTFEVEMRIWALGPC
jgi:hypothetical protein